MTAGERWTEPTVPVQTTPPPSPLGALLDERMASEVYLREKVAKARRALVDAEDELDLVHRQVEDLRALLWRPRLDHQGSPVITSDHGRALGDVLREDGAAEAARGERSLAAVFAQHQAAEGLSTEVRPLTAGERNAVRRRRLAEESDRGRSEGDTSTHPIEPQGGAVAQGVPLAPQSERAAAPQRGHETEAVQPVPPEPPPHAGKQAGPMPGEQVQASGSPAGATRSGRAAGVPRGELRKRVEELINSIGRWVTCAEAAEALGQPSKLVATTLFNACLAGTIAKRPAPNAPNGNPRYEYGALRLLSPRAIAAGNGREQP